MGWLPNHRIRLAPVFFLCFYTMVVYILLWHYHCGGFPGYGYYVTMTSSLFGFFSKDVTDLEDLFLISNESYSKYKNPVFDSFYIKPPLVKKRVTILIIVPSKPSQTELRNVIRDTWWTRCKPTESGIIPECLFMIDYQGPADEYFHQVQGEKVKYNDVHLQLVLSVHTDRSFLYHLVYATTMYEFDYFLRLEDNQMLCLDTLLEQLPLPMSRYFIWGTIHAQGTRKIINDTILLFSNDLVESFLRQDSSKLLCHSHIGRMVYEWMKQLGFQTKLRHDRRITATNFADTSKRGVCETFIVYKEVTVDSMRDLWERRTKGNFTGDLMSLSSTNTFSSSLPDKDFNQLFLSEPYLCKDIE